MRVVLSHPLASLVSWILLARSGAWASSNTSGIVEVDLVFPRNESYALSPYMPIVFAVRNSVLTPFLAPLISYVIWPYVSTESSVSGTLDLRWANFSGNDVYFAYRSASYEFDTEGVWVLNWDLAWSGCIDSTSDTAVGGISTYDNHTGGFIIFSTKNSSQGLDLVAATKNRNCSESEGIALNITDALEVPATVDWDGVGTCAVVAASTVAPDPCQVTVDAAVASSISSSITSRICRGTAPPISCPSDDEDESSAGRLAVTWWACLAFTIAGWVAL